MASLLKKSSKTGWSSVIVDTEAARGVAVAPAANGAKGKPRVLACAAQAADALDSRTLAALAKTLGSQGGNWLFILARADYKILVLPEPAAQASEMESSLRWGLANQIDFPVDDATIAWMKIPTTEQLPNRPTHVYVMVARRNRVMQFDQIFKDAGLKLAAVDVHETAQRNIANLVGQPGEGIGLLRIGRDGVQFTISFNGELYLDRFVEEQLFDDTLQDAESEQRAMERIALQVQRSLAFIERNMPFITVGRVLIAPLPRPMPIEKSLTEYLALPVQTLNLADYLDLSLTPDLLQERNQAVYFNALGAALRFTDH